jgi:hypothetical protein
MRINNAYRIYTSLRLHFTTENFDIRKGVVPKLPKTGIKLSFRNRLEQILKKYNNVQDFTGFFISNFIAGENWGAIFDPSGDDTFFQWKKIQESLTYVFTQDVELLSTHTTEIHELWNCEHGHPIILKLYYAKKIHLETLVILNKLFKFKEHVNEQLKNDHAWQITSRLIHKYSPFININQEKFSMIVGKIFNA